MKVFEAGGFGGIFPHIFKSAVELRHGKDTDNNSCGEQREQRDTPPLNCVKKYVYGNKPNAVAKKLKFYVIAFPFSRQMFVGN